MSRLFRWQTLVPRLILCVVVLLAIQFGLGRFARTIVVHSGEPGMGARIVSSHARVSLINRQIVLHDLRIDGVDKASTSRIEVDRCALDIAAKPLLYKKAVVESGMVTGLRLSNVPDDPNSPTEVGNESASSADWLTDGRAELASDWLERVDEMFAKDLLTQMESVRRTEDLCAHWPQDSAAIRARLDELKKRAARLRKDVRTAQANPLRHVEFLNNLAETVADLDADFAEVGVDAQTLLDSLEADRRAIVAARAVDDQFLSKQLQLEPVDANALTTYLLREEIAKPLNEVIGWLRWARHVVPAGAPCACEPARGMNVLFAGCRPSPSLLIRDLHLQGEARLGGQPFEFRGVLSDFTNRPARHAKPMQLRLTSTGSMPVKLQATIDRTGPEACDELLVDCGGISLPKTDLGRREQLSLAVAPSIGSLSISVAVRGEKLTGDIQLVQKQVQMTPALRGHRGGVALTAPLKETLSKIESFAVRVSLSGTLKQPKCALWSNLGPAVAESMERALQQSGELHARALRAQSQQQVDERLAGLERQAADQHAQFTAQQAEATGELAQLAGYQSPAKRLTREQLGRRLPANSLFR